MDRKCCWCKQIKPLEEFAKDRSKKFGRSYRCLICHKEKNKEYRKSHLDRIREVSRKYRKANIQRIKEYEKKKRLANPEKHRAEVEVWRKNNLEAVNERVKRWQRNHPKACAIWNARRNEKQKRTMELFGTASNEERLERFELFNNKCAYCEGDADTTDHLIAITNGGTDLIDNLIPACRRCNSSKGIKEWISWFRTQDFYSEEREIFISEIVRMSKL